MLAMLDELLAVRQQLQAQRQAKAAAADGGEEGAAASGTLAPATTFVWASRSLGELHILPSHILREAGR